MYLYRAIDQRGQAIDVLAAPKRDLAATRRFFTRALDAARRPTEVTTDRAPAYPRLLDELVPEAWHVVEQYANNPIAYLDWSGLERSQVRESNHSGQQARVVSRGCR